MVSACLGLAMAGPARGAGESVPVIASSTRLEEDVSLQFTCTSARVDGEYVVLGFKVQNNHANTFESVSVKLTAVGSDGKPLSSSWWRLEPSELRYTEEGRVRRAVVSTEGEKVSRVEYNVTGRKVKLKSDR